MSNYPPQYGGAPPGGVFGANAAMAPYGGMPPAGFGGGYGGAYGGGYQQQSAYNMGPAYAPQAMQTMQMAYGGNQMAQPQQLQMPPSAQAAMMNAQMNMASQQMVQWEMYKKAGLISESEEEDDEDDNRGKKGRKGKKGRRGKGGRRRRRYDEEEDEEEEEDDDYDAAEEAKKAKEKADKLAAKLVENEGIKEKVKQAFINEMMKRQELSGSFDITQGTIEEYMTYSSDDPVAAFYLSERQTDLNKEKWDCEADCEYLRKAMKGLGTNEAAIIHIVTTRDNAQRQEMKKKFKTMYGRDLIEDIHGELSGDFRESVMGMFVKPAIYDAWSVKESIYGLGTDEEALIEILMTRTNAQLQEMRKVYADVASPNRKKPDTVLDKDIVDDTSGDFKRLLVAAAQGNRDIVSRETLEAATDEMIINDIHTGMWQVNYEKLVNKTKVKRDSKRLFDAGEKKLGTDEQEFNLIFSVRDYYTLRAIYKDYVSLSQRDILNSVKRETSGDYRSGLRAIVSNITNRPMFFAERLKVAMKGLGTDEKTLIRIIVSRSEIDLIQIKACFLQLTEQTLWNWIKDDTSGDFKRMLLAIVGRD